MPLEKTNNFKVLAFDVFGTVVDWHGSVAREVDQLKLGVSGNEFALAWRKGYAPAMQRVMSGELGWIKNCLYRKTDGVRDYRDEGRVAQP